MNNTSNFLGKKILLLGGTSGIGLATAKAALQEGASVIVVSSRQASVDRALSELKERTEGYTLDLTKEDHIKEFFSKVGKFDHMVYTAGETLMLESIEKMDINQAKEAYNLRYWGAYMSVKYGSHNINEEGSVVLTTGVAGERPQKTWTIAASICGAMTSLTKALAMELAPIRVNAINPGVVRTDLWKNMSEEDRESMYSSISASLPTGKVGTAPDLAQAYLFAMRETYMTGQMITVDGGSVLV